ncbi:M20/M25/M40 family metallo-hydrolase [Corallococcus sp. EGB]|uniref:M20/M25/M40 family metallo-hydrolase n=1 Tax=Corallococcus sp. EGB TaxID=1521117 RepID=UPI00351D6A5C
MLLRADMDALPVRETTGLPYASTVTTTNADGDAVPVSHACGHDMHVACLLGAAHLLAAGTDHWNGQVVMLFQPAEETGDGARGMLEDGLARRMARQTGRAGEGGERTRRRSARRPPPIAVIMPRVMTPTMSRRAARTAVNAPLRAKAKVPVKPGMSSA